MRLQGESPVFDGLSKRKLATQDKWSIFNRANNSRDMYLENLKRIVLKGVYRYNSSREIVKVHYYNRPEFVPIMPFVGCPDACVMTSVTSDVSSSDAVIFQGPSLGVVSSDPPHKPPGQIWVMQGSEAPVHYFGSLTKWRRLFNWTMAYRRDADILHSYGMFVTKERQNVTKNSHGDTFIAKTSNNSVAWFVSNCHASSKREIYVRDLSKYVTVDIYGACGTLECVLDNYQQCIDRYRFYLSLENALCRDYITEKVFNVYEHSSATIPIVRGVTDQIELYLPPGSYINTDDFSSPNDLSEFLRKISQDKVLNEEFFEWKPFYEAYRPDPYCELCRMLHHSESHRRLYDDIDVWLWGSERNVCVQPKDV